MKPGGSLFVEEAKLTGEVMGDAPAVRKIYALLCKVWGSNSQGLRVGEKLEFWLWQTGIFSEFSDHGVIAPTGNLLSGDATTAQSHIHQRDGRVLDPRIRALGWGFTRSRTSLGVISLLPVARGKRDGFEALGFTPRADKPARGVSKSEWDG